jgi:oxalate decarboxylase/phosphoglucose isomerase-like protein (cupin superfamily)
MEEKMDTYQQGLNQQGIDRGEGTFSAAVAFRATEYEVIGDEFCGRLKKLPNNTVLAEGFIANTGHTHAGFAEIYFVIKGSLNMALYYPDSGLIEELTLGELDSLRIPAGVGHKVIGGTSDNRVMVSCEPAFIPGDEVKCAQLEQRYE